MVSQMLPSSADTVAIMAVRQLPPARRGTGMVVTTCMASVTTHEVQLRVPTVHVQSVLTHACEHVHVHVHVCVQCS